MITRGYGDGRPNTKHNNIGHMAHNDNNIMITDETFVFTTSCRYDDSEGRMLAMLSYAIVS